MRVTASGRQVDQSFNDKIELRNFDFHARRFSASLFQLSTDIISHWQLTRKLARAENMKEGGEKGAWISG